MDNAVKSIISIAVTIMIFFYFRWIGLKGLLGFVTGLALVIFIYENEKTRMFIETLIQSMKWK